MTKKIERSRVEAGKAELPRKLSFLSTEKVDYLVVIDRAGELSVEVPAAALSKLIKSRGELKALKGEQKKAAGAHVAALAAERAVQNQAASEHAAALAAESKAHQETRAALAKAERRIKALEKRLAANADETAAPVPAAVEKSAPKKSTRSAAPVKLAAPRKTKAAKPSVSATAAPSVAASAAPNAATPDKASAEAANAVAPMPTPDPVEAA